MKHRLFIAAKLPETTLSEIIGLQERLEKLNLPLRSEEQEKLHITFNFLGRVESEQISAINKFLLKVSNLYRPFSLIPAYMDTMYKKHDSSFIYLGMAGDIKQIKDLQKSLSRALTQLSLPQPEKFFPHITIARFKKADPVSIKSAMDTVSDFDFSPLSEFTFDNLTLYESFLSQKGSHFRQIGQFLLK